MNMIIQPITEEQVNQINHNEEIFLRLAADDTPNQVGISLDGVDAIGFFEDGKAIGYALFIEIRPLVVKCHVALLQQYRLKYKQEFKQAILGYITASDYNLFYAEIPDFINDINYFIKKMGFTCIGAFESDKTKFDLPITYSQYILTKQDLLRSQV